MKILNIIAMILDKILSIPITLQINPCNKNIGSLVFFKNCYVVYNTVGQRISYFSPNYLDSKTHFSFDINHIYSLSKNDGVLQYSYDFQLLKIIDIKVEQNFLFEYFDLKRNLHIDDTKLIYYFGDFINQYLAILEKNADLLRETKLDSVYNETIFIDFMAIVHLFSFRIYNNEIAKRVFKLVEYEINQSLETRVSTLKNKTMGEFLFEYFKTLQVMKDVNMMYDSTLLD